RGFPRLSLSPGQVPTRYSPVRPSCIATGVRLACVRHAASVRSEPGSNSQVSLAPPLQQSKSWHRSITSHVRNRQVSLSFLTEMRFQRRHSAPPPAHPFLLIHKFQRASPERERRL